MYRNKGSGMVMVLMLDCTPLELGGFCARNPDSESHRWAMHAAVCLSQTRHLQNLPNPRGLDQLQMSEVFLRSF